MLVTLLLSSASASRAQWERHGPFVPYPHVLCFAESGNKLFCGGSFSNLDPPTQHSVYFSTDNGITWVESDFGIPTFIQVEGFAVKGTTLFAGWQYLYRSTDDGASWVAVGPVGGAGKAFVLGDTSLYSIYTSTHLSPPYYTTALYYSTDNGASWTLIGDVLPCVTINNLILHGGYLFVAGEKGIYRSNDIKGKWTACNTGLPKNTYGLTEDIGSLVSNGTRLFAGGHGLFISEDNGESWRLRDSLGGGAGWIVVHGSDIYAAGKDGVYHSADNGDQWVNRGLTPFPISALIVHNNYLFAGAYSSNMYRASLDYIAAVEASPAEVPAEFKLEQNYPNPFNPTTRIKYTVGGAGETGAGVSGLGARKTMLVVYDLLGRQVATLVNEEKAPGSYEAMFDGAHLASGVYLYRLTIGSFAQSKTMMLLK